MPREGNTMPFNDEDFLEVCEEYRREHQGKSADALVARYNEVLDRVAELQGYARRSNAQDDELSRLHAETTVLDVAIADAKVLVRSQQMAARAAKIAEITRAAQNPANLERGHDDGSVPGARPGAPALVCNPGTRVESAAETIQRAGNPWRHDGGPLNRETAEGFIVRAHSAVEAVSERLSHDGAELLATLLSERRDDRGVSVRRSADEVRQGAEMILALSSPFYESAMRSVFRNPDLFSTGLGPMVWSDDEREAVHTVMNNMLVRAAFAETSGAVGAFALPLQLSPEILFTNAGIASPHRNLSRHELGTSNTWNGVTSAGATANWVAEGTAVTDTTPAIGQLVITPYKMMTWIFGSFEVLDDTGLSEQVPRLFDEARGRLEGSAFAIGTGSAQPFGAVTRAAADATAGNPTAALIYAQDQNLPPRFRNSGRVAWAANETVRNQCRQIPAFTGAVNSIVDDSGDVPRMLGYPFYESSAMLSGSVGNRELLLGDWSSFIIVDRLPSVVVAEPLVMSQATALPTGQRGWLNYSRVGSDTVTQGAALGSNAFTVHVH
jgi:HK97 family phage major capsid protein